MSAFDTIKYSITPYGTLGHWHQPSDFPAAINRKWSIRVLQDNAHIARGSAAFDYWMQVLINLPANAKELADAFWEQEEQRPAKATIEESLVMFVIQAVSASYENGDFISDFLSGISNLHDEFVKQQNAEIAKYYLESPLPENYEYALWAYHAKKYEDWLREEIFNHDVEHGN